MSEAGGATLLIDIGNSRVKWGWGRQGRVEAGEPFATQAGRAAFVRHWGKTPPPAHIVACNVAGADIAAELQAWAGQAWGLEPRFVRSEARGHGVSNGYEIPEKLGVDRWVALIGARRACPGPVCVADCGTAITVDAMDENGIHLGGVIAPGLALMRRALARGTSGLPEAQASRRQGLACDTATAIASGTLQAAAGLVERVFRETAHRLGHPPKLLLTGGDASELAGELGLPCEPRPGLVLEGLLVIAGNPP